METLQGTWGKQSASKNIQEHVKRAYWTATAAARAFVRSSCVYLLPLPLHVDCCSENLQSLRLSQQKFRAAKRRSCELLASGVDWSAESTNVPVSCPYFIGGTSSTKHLPNSVSRLALHFWPSVITFLLKPKQSARRSIGTTFVVQGRRSRRSADPAAIPNLDQPGLAGTTCAQIQTGPPPYDQLHHHSHIRSSVSPTVAVQASIEPVTRCSGAAPTLGPRSAHLYILYVQYQTPAHR